MQESHEGCPFAGGDEAGPEYAQYARTAELLNLQHPRTDAPAELSFIVSSQVMELLFLLIRDEWVRARTQLDADDVLGANRTLRRSVKQLEVLYSTWGLVGSLTPGEFGAFRGSLGEASGFQSHLYRELEFLLGNKRPAFLKMYEDRPEAHAALETALKSPGIYDAAVALLARRGLPVTEEGAQEAWVEVYSAEESYADLLDLGEALTDVSELWTRWRERHLAATLRAMGDRPGTGGSSGAQWLEKSVRVRPFPELWAMRTYAE